MDEKINNTETEIPESTVAEETPAAPEKESKPEKKKCKKLESEIEELKKKLEEKESEIAAANDQYLRMYAEFDNFRKRSAKERESIYTDATMDTLATILPILDNLERASQYKEADTVAKGVEMILRSFSETFEKLGVKEIEALGKTFDPNLHNAVMHVEDESFGENEIVEVLMKGYIKGDKVIRYAMVKVAN